jgi:hypothetical protein
MSSPWRISCRVRDSSNSAAKFSIGGAEVTAVMLEMAVAMGVGSFTLQGRRWREPFFSRGGRVVDSDPRAG